MASFCLKTNKSVNVMTGINMFKNHVEFDGINITVDGFYGKKGLQNVMPIFFEEQPITWLLFKDLLKNKFKSKYIKILDVGCGCGFWAILLKKKFINSKVWAIDKNKKAIAYTLKNALNNKVYINTVHTKYNFSNFARNSFDLVILSPPYHIYPPEIKDKVPYFARGGSDGQTEFVNQLEIAEYHLKKEGLILFNMMCIGDQIGPKYLEYISQIFKNKLYLRYYNIFEPIATRTFITGVYPFKKDNNYLLQIIKNHPFLYYTSGVIERDKNKEILQLKNEINLKRSWKDRIELHKEINKF